MGHTRLDPQSPILPACHPDTLSCSAGGFYYCTLEQRDDMPEYSAASSGDAGSAAPGGPFAWLAGAWSSIKAAAQQQQLQRHLRQHLRYSGGAGAIRAAAAHMQLLLGAAGVLEANGSSSGAVGTIAAAGQLGVSPGDASRMSSQEWGDVVAAAAASAADAVALPASMAVPPTQAAADAALVATTSGSGGKEGSGSASGGQAAYLRQLSAGVVVARSLLQHSAVALYEAPAGPGRRHLQQLSSSIQQRLEQLEPLLLALPEREAAATAAAAAQPGRQLRHPARSGKPGGGGGGGVFGWLLQRLYGVDLPAAEQGHAAAHPELAALSGEVLVQQLQFAAAVHQQRAAVQAALRGLEADMAAMVAAARAGLFA